MLDGLKQSLHDYSAQDILSLKGLEEWYAKLDSRLITPP